MHRTALGLVGCFLVCAGCGGGGGAAPWPGPATFSGTYHYLGLEAMDQAQPPAFAESATGRVTTGAAGVLNTEYLWNSGGAIVHSLPSSADRYSLAPGGILGWTTPSALPGIWAWGGVRPDGELAVVACPQAGLRPRIGFLIRRGGNFTVNALEGVWHIVQWFNVPTDDANQATAGTITFDAAGDWNWSVSGTRDGQQFGAGNIGSSTIAPGGDITIDVLGSLYQGGLHQGGEVAAVGGPEKDFSWPGMMVLLAQTTGATNALLSGSYWIVRLEHSPQGYLSAIGTLTATGSGVWTSTQSTNRQGVVAANQVFSGTYQVQADGVLRIIDGAGNQLPGAVAPSGSVAAAGGALNVNGPQVLWILVRK